MQTKKIYPGDSITYNNETLAAVATSGLYTDLSNKPTLWKSGVNKSNFIEYISSAVVASGTVSFNLTDDGLSSGNVIFTTVFKESANFWIEDSQNQYQYSGYSLSENKKVLTVTINRLGSVLLGIVQFISAANGVTVYLTIKGE